MQVENTAAIVTGGASGLGAATAAALAEQGASVYAFDLPAAIEDAPSVAGVTYVAVDVTDPDQVAKAVDQAAGDPAAGGSAAGGSAAGDQAAGGSAATGSATPLRVVVNCAGIGPSARILSKRGVHDLALYAKIVQINLIGTFNVLALASEKIAATEPLEDGQRGVVVNTASIAAFEGQIGQAAYASSKGGIVGLNLPAARDLAQYGIRVNTIAPGIVETPMLATVAEEFREKLAAGIPFPSRLGRPGEYADLAMFLINHDYINGEVIRMDGALRMAPR